MYNGMCNVLTINVMFKKYVVQHKTKQFAHPYFQCAKKSLYKC